MNSRKLEMNIKNLEKNMVNKENIIKRDGYIFDGETAEVLGTYEDIIVVSEDTQELINEIYGEK